MDSKTYRNLIGRFATGVTVVTNNVDGNLHGMTANSVTSVSLDPILLLVCVVKGNRCHQQLSQSEHFGINILGADQQGLSNLFAKSGEPESSALRGAEFQLTENGVPWLEDCLVRLECRKHSVLEGGDHDLFVGEVLRGEEVRPGEPLLFFGGQYRELLPEPS